MLSHYVDFPTPPNVTPLPKKYIMFIQKPNEAIILIPACRKREDACGRSESFPKAV